VEKACDIWSMGVIMYILLCGYPPFYASHGGKWSIGIETRIKAGEYEFDKADWHDVSEEAQSTIRRMLIVIPAERITIDEILNCSWLTEPASERLIDMTSLCDEENRNQIQVSRNYHSFLKHI
jgi:serine/threonine protein kinase